MNAGCALRCHGTHIRPRNDKRQAKIMYVNVSALITGDGFVGNTHLCNTVASLVKIAVILLHKCA